MIRSYIWLLELLSSCEGSLAASKPFGIGGLFKIQHQCCHIETVLQGCTLATIIRGSLENLPFDSLSLLSWKSVGGLLLSNIVP